MPDGPDDDMPEVGAGSARWLHDLKERHVVAAGVGAFFGNLVGRILDPGPEIRFDQSGALVITSKQGMTLTLAKANVPLLWAALHRQYTRYHLGTTDEDLEGGERLP